MIGQMVPKWAAAQQSYLDWLERQETGKRWLIELIMKLLNISWDMWDHRTKILHVNSHPWNMIMMNWTNILTNSMAKGMYIFNGRTIGGCSAHW
jgi:hypothetical protein